MLKRIGVHSLMKEHVNNSFKNKASYGSTLDSFWPILFLYDGKYNQNFFTKEYCTREIKDLYIKRKHFKVFRGKSVREAILNVFKYHLRKKGVAETFLAQYRISQDLGVCTKTVQREIIKMRKEGIMILTAKWNQFKKKSAEYKLTEKGLSLISQVKKVFATVASKAIDMINKVSDIVMKYKHLPNYVIPKEKWSSEEELRMYPAMRREYEARGLINV